MVHASQCNLLLADSIGPVRVYSLFFIGLSGLAIIIFTFAAILDGVDGIVARNCDMVTEWGEWLDPMCDKLTYLPPLIGFAYAGILSSKFGLDSCWC